ncbi:HdeD family acid-resistance protein [Enterococcus crotali]
MNNVMEQLRKYALLRGIVYIIFGVLILINPRSVFQLAVYFISAYIAIMGVLNLYDGFRVKKATGTYGMSFLGGIVLLVIAGIVLVFAKGIVSILPIFLGLVIVIVGVTRVIQSVNLRTYVNVSWLPMLIYSVILIIAGLVLTFNPFSSLLVLFQLFGGILIFMGIGEVVSFFQLRNID